MIYNNSAGKSIISKCQHTEEFTRKLRALLYYVHMATYNRINCKCPRVLTMHFYRLVRFHTWRRFCTRLSVRVFYSGHPVTHGINFFTNKPGHRIYRCIPARYTQHYALLHNPMILHTKTFFAPACHPCKKISSKKKLPQYSLIHPRSPHTSFPLQNVIPNKIESKHYPFYFFRVRVRVRVTV